MTRWFVYEWGKPTRQKPYRMIFRSPLPKFHYYHNKWLQVNESQYATSITPTEKIVDYKVLQFIHTMKIKKIFGHKTLQCKYTATSPRERWTRSRTLSRVTIFLNRVCSMLVQLVYSLTALKTILLYV